MARTLFTNVHIIDPVLGLDTHKDILITDGVIEKVAEHISAENVNTIDVRGRIGAPGFYDMHVHFREPGYEYKEDLATGAASAAAGGFTGVACMPNTSPPIDSAETIALIKERARTLPVDIDPIGAVTKARKGEQLAPLAEMFEAGAVAFTDDGDPVHNAQLMRLAMEYAKMMNVPVMQHAEDPDLAGNGVINEGYMSTLLGLSGIPSIAEDVMVARDIMLAEYIDARYHVLHVSTAGSIHAVRLAKEKGLNVTAEVTPHHFTLAEEAVLDYDHHAKMNPPLRTMDDVMAAKEGLRDGAIDVIATDHAPHAEFEKEVEFMDAPMGIVGLETAIGLACTELVDKGYLSLQEMIEKFSTNPRRILRLPDIRIEEGQKANLTFFDPEEEWTVEIAKFASKSKNSPFDGYKLKGKPLGIFNKDQLVWNLEAS